ncbi:hypothetical protein I2F20_01070 [Acinetobacter sp. EC115]|nr:hypothetical protein [Acinetobacter rathckeae]
MMLLGLNSRDAMNRIQKDPSFPAGIKMGVARQAPVFFCRAEVMAWIEEQKAKRPVSPTHFGKIESQECVA